ncbi:hypothetical protein [Chlamydia sp.]|uniref:hypothetical protein n=1 Tax=Chlamydia sp. TaxID=35827 RepID=UPI0025C39585|nr:hypothetical protein [Chlamydia sp.]MBQ8498656.1 hypothetical protein [Chlamydia sp.]
MRRFFLFFTAATALLTQGCSYEPPKREYILAQKCSPLFKHAQTLGFSLAQAVFENTFSTKSPAVDSEKLSQNLEF